MSHSLRNISGIGWLVGGSFMSETFLAINVTVWYSSQVQPTKMTLARQRVLSSSEVRASDLEHGGSWVRIPSGAQIFSVSSYGWLFTSPFIIHYNINISGVGWLVGGPFMGETFLAINVTAWCSQALMCFLWCWMWMCLLVLTKWVLKTNYNQY